MRISFQVCCPKSSTSPWWRNTRRSRTTLRAKYRRFRRSWSKQKRPLPILGGLSGSSRSISSPQSWQKRWRESNAAHRAKTKAERWAANDGHKYPKRICEQCGKVLYSELLTTGKLNDYLADLNEQAEELFSRLVKQLAEKEGMTETLKAEKYQMPLAFSFSRWYYWYGY